MLERYLQKEVPEALLRSCLFVLVDNATAEYSFITSFFTPESIAQPASSAKELHSNLFSKRTLSVDDVADDAQSNIAPDMVFETPRVVQRTDVTSYSSTTPASTNPSKDDQITLLAMWKQILDPALDHTQVSPIISNLFRTFCRTDGPQNLIQSVLDPLPPVIPLLTMIRMTEEIMTEIQKRGCPPLENYVFGIRLQMWPLFQKSMTEQIDSLKRLAEGASGSYFRRAAETTDASVSSVCRSQRP